MSFLTSCYVKVKDKDERKELVRWCKSIGWTVVKREGDIVLADASISRVAVGNFTIPKSSSRINCYEDIEQFKAFAARNDENDLEQWFTNGTLWKSEDKEWLLCKGENFADWAANNHSSIPDRLWHSGFIAHAHKANVSEIRAHFEWYR